MKNLIFISLVSIFVLIGCNKIKQNKKGVEKNNNFKPSYATINQDKNVFKVYYTKLDSSYSSVDSMIIFFDNKIQNINLKHKNYHFKTRLIDVLPIYTNSDYNFDGFNDISLKYDEEYVTHETLSYHWFFNKKKKIYEENNQLDSIYDVELCESKKIICSRHSYKTSGEFVDDLTLYKKYKWIKDSLKPIKIIEERPLKINDGKPINISENDKLENVKYLIIENDLIKKTKKEYISKNSIIDNINCE